VPATGICTNARCAKAASGEHIERYSGAGEFCPECGEHLTPVSNGALPGTPETVSTPRSVRWLRRPTTLIAAGFAVLVLALLPSIASRFFITPLRVCTTTSTERLVDDIVRTYTSKHRLFQPRLVVGPDNGEPCHIRFWTAVDGAKSSVLAHDAVVVVVNPKNSISQLTGDQVRAIFSGRVTDWSQVNGTPGAIDGADEVQTLRNMLFHDMQVADRVHRVPSSTRVVQSVTAANAPRAIGIVAFSAAIPAKVVAFSAAPPPSTLSIADHRFPLSVRIMLASDFRQPPAGSAALIDFARSSDGGAIIARNGFVKEGF
jgi:hypothetical protein